MNLVLRFGRWSLTVAFGVDDDDDGPAMSSTSDNEIAPGFQPPDAYWDDEDKA